MKIIQIDGIRGLLTAAFIGVCLFAGFVIFPGFTAMYLWNKYLVNLCMFPVLNLFQGVLLWGIVAVSYAIVFKQGFAVSFKNTPELSKEELDSIINSAKMNSKVHMMRKIMPKPDNINLVRNEKEKNDDKNNTYISSPISLNNKQVNEKNEEQISNMK